MKFRLTAEQANQIYYCAKGMDIEKLRENMPKFSVVQCNITDNTLTAQCVQMYGGCKFSCEVIKLDDTENKDFVLVPPTSKFKSKIMFVDVTANDDCTIYETADGTMTLPMPYGANGNSIDIEPRFNIKELSHTYINPRILKKALDVYSTLESIQPIKIEICEKDNSGYSQIILRDKRGIRTVILPVRADF